jgi:hypothetical protein
VGGWGHAERAVTSEQGIEGKRRMEKKEKISIK